MKQTENVLDVLIYLFENALLDDDYVTPDQDTLSLVLRQAGFAPDTIFRAFGWLEDLAESCEQHARHQPPTTAPTPRFAQTHATALRHYSPAECARLGVEGRGLLLNLEQCEVLDGPAREMVVNQIMALENHSISLDNIRWVILMVLSNYDSANGISELTESLVLGRVQTSIH